MVGGNSNAEGNFWMLSRTEDYKARVLVFCVKFYFRTEALLFLPFRGRSVMTLFTASQASSFAVCLESSDTHSDVTCWPWVRQGQYGLIQTQPSHDASGGCLPLTVSSPAQRPVPEQEVIAQAAGSWTMARLLSAGPAGHGCVIPCPLPYPLGSIHSQ